jgi:hypothetical protein
MQLSDDDRILEQPQRRSSALRNIVLAIIVLGGAGFAAYYWQSRPAPISLDNVKQAVTGTVQTAEPADTVPTQPAPSPTDIAAAASEPPLQPDAAAAPLPPLDSSDDGLRQELSGLTGWQADKAFALLAKDQWLRRFVTFVNNIAAGKVDHKTGIFQPMKGKFTVSSGMPLTATAESQARYNVYVELITALDPQQCASVYRRYYPLLNSAYNELGEKGNFHVLMLKAIQQLENTPELSQAPVLVPNDKGLYQYAQPQLEALPAAQKQLLRSGWENVSRIKIWLRQLRAALVQPPAG